MIFKWIMQMNKSKINETVDMLVNWIRENAFLRDSRINYGKGQAYSGSVVKFIYKEMVKEQYGADEPYPIQFSDGQEDYMLYDEIYEWMRHYDSSPTTCKTKDEFEKKLLAIRI